MTSVFDSLGLEEAREALTQCCGSSRWVEGMLARRPFGSMEALKDAASRVWAELGPEDYLEAFAHHPAIGADLPSLRAKFPATASLSSAEQAGVGSADDDTLHDLADLNGAYLARFGFIFIVCATGKSATDMLALLRARLENDPDTELRTAAAEQAMITALRLERAGL